MEKKEIYKILAIIIVVLFVVEGIALGLMNSGNRTAQPTPGALPSFSGYATANMTILGYEPYLIISGHGEEAEKVKNSLIDRGIATYDVKADKSIVLNLKSGKLAHMAAEELEKANATVIASATIATQPRVRVEGDGISTLADGASFRVKIYPRFEEGEAVPARFMAEVKDGKLVSIQNLAFLPYTIAAQAEASVASVERKANVEVPWESRLLARQIAKQENASYLERSYIVAQENATEEQLKAAFSASKDFATGAKKGMISVRNDFADKKLAQERLQQMGIAPIFPPSVFQNLTDQQAEALIERLKDAGIEANISYATKAKLKLPSMIEAGGKEYSLGGEMEIDAEIPQNATSVMLDLELEVLGRKAAIISAKHSQSNASASAALWKPEG